MTQKDLADILHISRSTVSLALSDSPKIKAETSSRIRELARKSNYQPDLAARSLVMGKTNLIGVLLPSFAHRFLGELSNEIFLCLNAKRFSAIFVVGSNAEEYSQMLDSMLARKVDGIIAYSAASEKLVRLHESGTPVVVYRNPGDKPLSYVDVDRYEGSRMLVQHLISMGRHRIAFIGGVNKDDQRFPGYQAALRENNIDIDESVIENLSGEMREGIKGMQILLERNAGNLPDAVMFHNDAMAIGGMNEAIQSGIRVPAEMAITGFDDIEEAQYCVPGLTTVSQPKKEIAAELVNMLMEQINEKKQWHPFQNKKILQPTLIVRKSSCS
ncbi:MAG: LacI family DNA-binding transcriptional regulator [Lentisphaeria bacterium]